MSTRAKIGILLDGNKVKSINIWQDGYPEYCGNILAKHYNTPEKIHKLMERGNLLGIEKSIKTCRYEAHTEPTTYPSIAQFINDKAGMDYIYAYTEAKGWEYLKLNE